MVWISIIPFNADKKYRLGNGGQPGDKKTVGLFLSFYDNGLKVAILGGGFFGWAGVRIASCYPQSIKVDENAKTSHHNQDFGSMP